MSLKHCIHLVRQQLHSDKKVLFYTYLQSFMDSCSRYVFRKMFLVSLDFPNSVSGVSTLGMITPKPLILGWILLSCLALSLLFMFPKVCGFLILLLCSRFFSFLYPFLPGMFLLWWCSSF